MTEPELDPLDRIIGANIRRLRLARDMSQSQLGGFLPVTIQQIQKYESGKNGISAADLGRLAVALRCTLDELFRLS